VGGGVMAVSSRADRPRMRDVFADAEQIQKLFDKAWPRAARYPDIWACHRLAVSINVVRVAPHPAASENPIAIKYGRLLLRHLPVLRQNLKAELHYLQTWKDVGYPAGDLVNRTALLDTIERTEQCVGSLVEAWKPARPRLPNPATFIANKVQEEWAGVPDAKGTRSNAPNSPLCFFVREALGLAGKHFALETVSDMLRERHHRERPRTPKKNQRKQPDRRRGQNVPTPPR
jgi:hypothetical protein